MNNRLVSQFEPIPGYRLIEQLGSGGFGEVWKAQAPGGIPKAIKFVHGSLSSLDGGVPAAQELKALNRVKNVHHPFLLGLERIEIIDDQLIIVMELADCNLHDRLHECQREGLPGIPRTELLRYMRETAEALDLMNIECQLQHLDIKPQNLFVVQHHVKVADFGLVKDLEGMTGPMTSGVTPLYAAPETFEGRVSRFTDQYSLAIVYQELLTGRRPFDGKSARALLMQHLKAAPDLAPLPPGDREIVGRALAKKPSDRFSTCGEFAQALQRASTVTVSASASGSSSARLKETRNILPLPGRAAMRPAEPAASRIESPMPPARPPISSSQVDLALERAAPPERNNGPSPEPDDQSILSARPTPTVKPPSSADTLKMALSSKHETVKIEKADARATQPPPAQDIPCPRCSALLINPGPYAWCGRCGYPAESMTSPATARSLPAWCWVVIGGVGVMSMTVAVDKILQTSDWPPDMTHVLLFVTGACSALFALAALVQTRIGRRKQKQRCRKTHIRPSAP